MTDHTPTEAQLMVELTALRRRVAELEAAEIERKRVEESLRETERRLLTVLRTARIYLWYWDILGDELRLLRFFDPTPKIGTYADFLEQVHPEDRDNIRQAMSRTFEEGLPYYTEYRDFTSEGDIRWNISQGLLQYDEAGRPLSLIGVEQDITAQKQAEAALRASEEQLRQVQKLEAIGRLAGGIAHDFNNLLTIIFGNCAFLLDSLDQAHPLRPDAEQIQRTAERAASLTRQLLAFSRQQLLQPQILNLNTIIMNTEKLLRRLIGEDIELVIRLEPNLGLVKADPGQLEQVILNLAVNARDAMPNGGKLTLETADVYLDSAYARQHPNVQPGPHVRLSVSDTGLGMDAATRERLFEPFFTTKETGEGTGLGLAMVHGIINQSGGHIWVYSEPGYGAIFKIYLPRVEGTVTVAKPELPLSEALPAPATILLVEDETLLREVTERLLEDNGYQVLAAENGQVALQYIGNYQSAIDLLLTDVIMPGGLNGPQLAETLTAHWPGLKVIFMSGYTNDMVASYGVLEPSLNFLQKPFTPKTLLHKIRKVLDT